jgi:lycopene beta-cyclase
MAQIEWRNERIGSWRQSADSVEVLSESGESLGSSKYLFSSIPRFPEAKKGQNHLLQHFLGWFVETPTEAFDPENPTLMDFSVPQQNECRFMYVLPLSTTKALVEFTLFSAELLSESDYEQEIQTYLGRLGIGSYEVKEKEFGVIPMFSSPFPTQEGDRVFFLGSTGGRSKASTGYTFTRIQRHSDFLARQLVKTGKPTPMPEPWPGRFSFYDWVLLDVIANKRSPASLIFERLFKYNKASTVFAFLDEDTHFAQELVLLNTVPILPFMSSALRKFLGLA